MVVKNLNIEFDENNQLKRVPRPTNKVADIFVYSAVGSLERSRRWGQWNRMVPSFLHILRGKV